MQLEAARVAMCEQLVAQLTDLESRCEIYISGYKYVYICIYEYI